MTVKPGYIRTKMTQDTRLPKYLTTDPNRLAKRVYRAYITERNIVYYLPVWRWIMLLIRYMPESIFKRLDL
jgi:short-subunit dehydrogenase